MAADPKPCACVGLRGFHQPSCPNWTTEPAKPEPSLPPDFAAVFPAGDWAPMILMLRDMQKAGATPAEAAVLMSSMWMSAAARNRDDDAG